MSPYYRYKKEKFLEKYQSAYDNLEDLKEAIIEYKKNNSRIIKRAVFAFFQDFSEYIIDMSETYLVITGNYTDGCSGIELIKRANLYNFIDDNLAKFLISVVVLRNRYTHDYYKREKIENDILMYSIEKMELLEIFLQITEEKVR